MEKLGKKFWLAMSIFGLMGQVAWVVENMYFNVFIYKMFNAVLVISQLWLWLVLLWRQLPLLSWE